MKLKLMTNEKGMYRYQLFNDTFIMKRTIKFPLIENISNDSTNTSCPIEDYNFAIKGYNTFISKNLDECTLLYYNTDTLILAEIMMVYRKSFRIISKWTKSVFREPRVIIWHNAEN